MSLISLFVHNSYAGNGGLNMQGKTAIAIALVFTSFLFPTKRKEQSQ